jgi:hypothetical protein
MDPVTNLHWNRDSSNTAGGAFTVWGQYGG